MPTLTVYLPKELAEAVKDHPSINKSKVAASALRQAIRRAEARQEKLSQN